jgi:hypothetical protein
MYIQKIINLLKDIYFKAQEVNFTTFEENYFVLKY